MAILTTGSRRQSWHNLISLARIGWHGEKAPRSCKDIASTITRLAVPKPAGSTETDAFSAENPWYVDTLETRLPALGALADDIRAACTLVEHY